MKTKIVFLLIVLGAGHTPKLAAQPGGTFASAGDMTSPRFHHSATLLTDGRAVIAGATYVVADGRPGNTDGSLIRISNTNITTIADKLGCPVALDTDQAGNFLVADPCSRPVRILKVTPSGEVATLFAGPPLMNPIALVVEPSGSIIVADNANDSLFRISPDGESIKTLVQLPALLPCGFNENQDMNIVLTAPSGDLLVTSDECASLRIFRVTAEGAITETITPRGVLSSSGLRLEPSGNMLIVDFRQQAIFRVTPAGIIAATVAQELCCNVVGLAVDPISGDLLTLLNFEAELLRVDTTGVVNTVAKGGLLTFPHALVVEAPVSTTTTPAPLGVAPAAGDGTTQTFTFTFSDTGGWQNLNVVDVLINNVLDGQQACYFAVVPSGASSGAVYLVYDAGNAGGPYMGMLLPGSSSVSNSQCSIAGSGSSVSGSGNTLILTLTITFTASFAGNKVFYLGALDASGSSGWQTLGVWSVPGSITSGPGVVSVSPAHSTTSPQTYVFTFNDTNGFADLAMMNVLINSALDGRGACYIALIPSGPTAGSVYLVDDAGDSGGPYAGAALPGTDTIQNSQCSISGIGGSVSGSGNTLTLILSMTFKPAFAGNKVIYMAARSAALNSSWQSMGTISVP